MEITMARVLCIEIGYSLMKICEMDYKNKNPRIYKTISIETPKEVLLDGEITVTPKLVETLKETLSSNKIRTRQAIFSITSTKIASREIYIPVVKENKIETLIKTNSTDYFPIDLELYEVGHIVLGTVEREKIGQQYKVMVLAVPKMILEGYTQLAKAIDLNIYALDYSGNSIYQVVKKRSEAEVEMVIKVDEKTTIITILNQRSIVLQRTIAYGVDDGIEILKNQEKYLNLSYGELLQLIKNTKCLEGPQNPVVEGLNYLVSGISRVVDYYHSKHSNQGIQKVSITGLGASFRGLETIIGSKLELPVNILVKAQEIIFDKNSEEADFNQYISCIGAGIAPLFLLNDKMGKQKEQKQKARHFELGRFAVAMALLGTIISSVLIGISSFKYSNIMKEQKQLQGKIYELEGVEQVYIEYLQEQYRQNKFTYLYNNTVKPNENLVEFIQEMEIKMPSSLAVVSFTSNESGVNISLSVERKDEAAKLIQQFRSFQSINVTRVSEITDSGAVLMGGIEPEQPRVSFNVSMSYKGAEQNENIADENIVTSVQEADGENEEKESE